jgi:leucyl-tRNA synthetase
MMSIMQSYDHRKIERKWRRIWKAQNSCCVAKDSGKKKFYALIEFPYPSGNGLHVGHPRPYIGMDIIARKRRMEGYNVLYPIGWDAFGLPTENYAIKTGIHPSTVTKHNTRNFKRQIQSLSISFDWSREINTTDPKYYRWTQWIFLQFLKRGLAYKKRMPINWCLSCKIGLANEEVVDGRCERCGGETEKRDKEQWMLAITKYADRLDRDLDTVDYLPRIKAQQRNWIGKSEGIDITYAIDGQNESVAVFTTRPDTNFGATFIVAAPDSPFVRKNLDRFPRADLVRKYVVEATAKSEAVRMAEGRAKTGVFTGWYARNRLNDKKLPVYIGDFVLGSVGTGVVVGVPGHDRRDFEFAQAMGIDIVRVVVGPDRDSSPVTRIEQVQEEAGVMVHSDFLDGLDIHAATKCMMDHLEERKWGTRVTTYKLRDWVFSRQRYWGEPIPVIHCVNCGIVPVPEKDLPVKLPNVENYTPTDTGESPLAAVTSWVNVTCPVCKGPAKRETDTMPNWAGSSWYYIAYCIRENLKSQFPISRQFSSSTIRRKIKYWLPVDWYNGGMEHTTLHLLYSRFWHKFLYDEGLVPTPEPYAKRTSHGLILAEGGEKMSKSRGNVVNPDKIVELYGADTLRVYEMFMGPFDQAISWSTDSMVGVRRFLERVYRMIAKASPFAKPPREIQSLLHQTIKKVTDDIESMHFNTAISSLMIFLNRIEKDERVPTVVFVTFLLLLAPFAPHITEELWSALGKKRSIHKERWPAYIPELARQETVTVVVQINGKVRARFDTRSGEAKDALEKQALGLQEIQKWLKEGVVRSIIVVPDRIVNIVVS